MNLDANSVRRLRGVHPDLVRVIEAAAENSPLEFIITQGVRTVEEQRRNVAKGASRTMRSRHIPGRSGLAHAVDVAVKIDGEVRWDWPLYERLAKHIMGTARRLGIPLEWGGDWKMRDGPHYQLPWRTHPDTPIGELAALPEPDEPRRDHLSRSRTAQGAVAASAGGGVALFDAGRDLVYDLQEADGHISAGTIFGLVLGAVIVAGALYALYARWDDAGRPLPWGRK